MAQDALFSFPEVTNTSSWKITYYMIVRILFRFDKKRHCIYILQSCACAWDGYGQQTQIVFLSCHILGNKPVNLNKTTEFPFLCFTNYSGFGCPYGWSAANKICHFSFLDLFWWWVQAAIRTCSSSTCSFFFCTTLILKFTLWFSKSVHFFSWK